MRKRQFFIFTLCSISILLKDSKAQTIPLLSGYSINFNSNNIIESIDVRFTLFFLRDTNITVLLKEDEFKKYKMTGYLPIPVSLVREEINWKLMTNQGDTIYSKNWDLSGKYIGKYKKLKLRLKKNDLVVCEKNINLRAIREHLKMNNSVRFKVVYISVLRKYDLIAQKYSDVIFQKNSYSISLCEDEN